MGASESKSFTKTIEEFENFNVYKGLVDNGVVSELRCQIDKDINQWKSVPINIAVTGNSGVGKSSFINSFRGLKPYQVGAAEVGVNETTKVPTKYVHPENENLALWDLPGLGTINFPKTTYLQDVEFHKYDFFIILTATRFTKNDLWLAEEVRNLGKKFILVRTKIGLDVENAKYDYPENSREDTVRQVRKAMLDHIANAGLLDIEVFLIDNHCPLHFDFPKLNESLIDSAPTLKQEAMILTITNLTAELIQRKRDILRKRMLIVALGSAAGAAVPLPGTSYIIDTAIVSSEINFYKQQLGLDDKSLRQFAQSRNESIDGLQERLKLKSILGKYIGNATMAVVNSNVPKTAKSISQIFVKAFGNVLSSGISYAGTIAVLRSSLDDLVSEAERLNNLVLMGFSTNSKL